MKLEEALAFKQEHFSKWYNKSFPKNKAEISDIWIIPEDEHFHGIYFFHLHSNEPIGKLSTGNTSLDIYALAAMGNWREHDEFTFMFDLRYEDGTRRDYRRFAKEFLLDEGYEDQDFLRRI
jgi:hypothetical protein